MDWHLRYSQFQARLTAASKRKGSEVGTKEPVLYRDVVPYWNAFFMLNASRRQSANGGMSITVSDIAAYLSINGVEDIDAKTRYYEAITALDVVFLRYVREEQEQKQQGKNGSIRSKS